LRLHSAAQIEQLFFLRGCGLLQAVVQCAARAAQPDQSLLQ